MMTDIVKVRELNDAGLEEFRVFISRTRDFENTEGRSLPGPVHMLSDSDFLEDIEYDVTVDLNRSFPDRFEFGKYLVDCFGDEFDVEFYKHAGLWAWLALAYFAKLRGKKSQRRNGIRTATQKDEHFVPHEWRKGTGRSLAYRHSVRTAFRMVKNYGDDARFFASKQGMEYFGDMAEQTASDTKIMSSRVLRKLILDLYQDKDGFAKKGTTAHRPASTKTAGSRKAYGKLRRLMDDYLPRVQLTYDVNEMKPDEIRKLCGNEFA